MQFLTCCELCDPRSTVILQCNSCMNAAALMALKRKKRYDKQLQQIDGTLSTIEFQREALQNASTNTEVLRVMGDAAKALKSAHKNMYVDQYMIHISSSFPHCQSCAHLRALFVYCTFLSMCFLYSRTL